LRIVSVEAVPLAVSFTRTFRFGTMIAARRPMWCWSSAPTTTRWGFGEACPVPAFTSETQASVVELVKQRVAPVLRGQDPTRRGPLLADLAKVLTFAPFTTAAVDTALLDLTGRALGVPVSALLGGAYRDRVEVHGSVGWDEDAARMVDVAVEQAATYRSLKTYAGRGDVDADLDRLQAVRDAVDPGRGSPSAPALGETAADLALEVHTNRDLKAFALARFAGGRVPRPAMMI
jgi:L-alanine-DL-glutamate epimerase-like enolase superfamily enzyme